MTLNKFTKEQERKEIEEIYFTSTKRERGMLALLLQIINRPKKEPTQKFVVKTGTNKRAGVIRECHFLPIYRQ